MTKQELDKRIHDTYYSYKNTEILPSFIILGVFFLVCSHTLFLEIGLWTVYAWICYSNNERLRSCPTVKKEREFLLKNYDKLLD